MASYGPPYNEGYNVLNIYTYMLLYIDKPNLSVFETKALRVLGNDVVMFTTLAGVERNSLAE